MYFRMLRHLLPDGEAWKLARDTAVRKFVEGLAFAPFAARAYLDLVFDDENQSLAHTYAGDMAAN